MARPADTGFVPMIWGADMVDQASLDQAKANLELANVTFKRTNSLTQRGYETVQNNDNQRTQVNSQQAAVETAEAGIKVAAANELAQQATVDRLEVLTRFEQVIAPFDGSPSPGTTCCAWRSTCRSPTPSASRTV